MKYHHIKVETNSNVKPSLSLISSSLRGTFGHFLKNQTCISASYDCDHCSYAKACIYYAFYETDDAPPFRFDAELYADRYDFGIYIYGDAAIVLRPILSALNSMLHTKTITDRKLSFPHSTIFLNKVALTFDDKSILQPFSDTPQTLKIAEYHREVEIQLVTPLYLKSPKSRFKNTIEVEDILLSIFKRKHYFEHGEKVFELDYTPDYRLITSELKVFREKTRSDRQQKYLALLGLVGRVVLADLDEKSFELLKWGEILALGNKVTKGQGVIALIY